MGGRGAGRGGCPVSGATHVTKEAISVGKYLTKFSRSFKLRRTLFQLIRVKLDE